MESTQSWQLRQQSQKAERKKQVTRTALRVFMEQGIENATMNDVAGQAAIGIASLYRYFQTKQDLVIASASLFWQEDIRRLFDRHEQQAPQAASGLDRAIQLLGIYLELYDNGKHFFRFIEQFDQFVIRQGIDPSELAEYDRTLLGIRQLFERAIQAGMGDGSIRGDIDVSRFSATVAQALLSFAQKLTSRGRITPSDQDLDARRELELLIDMIRVYLSRS